MRTLRWIAVGMVLGATLALPLQAQADGGAFIELRGGTGSHGGGTHFLPGDTATGTAYVSIPEHRQGVLDAGPFYAYLITQGWIREGRPLPPGVIRLGTVTIERDSRDIFRVQTSFTVPDVPGDFYSVQICNDPCTISGFRESLTGSMSIVQTTREAELLNEQQKLNGKNWGLRRQLRKAGKENDELRATIASLYSERDALAAQIDSLSSPTAAPTLAPAATDGRPLVEAWALVAIAIAVIVALGAVALGLVFSRRHGPRIVVPDTIAELGEESGELLHR